jgi:hypothetical protein
MYNFQLNAIILDFYLDALNDISPEELHVKIRLGIKNNLWKFMPKPGEILEVGSAPKADKRVKAKECFDKILAGARRGSFPKLEENELKALRLSGGFESFRMCADDELKWLEKKFVEIYEEIGEQQNFLTTSEEIKKLVGTVLLKQIK